MSLQIKIHGATPKSGKTICSTCKHVKIIKGQNCEEIFLCHLFAHSGNARGPVTFRVSECGEYHPINIPWLWEMEEMAWKIEARRRGPSGFQKPDENEMEIVITRPNKANTVQGQPASPEI